MIGKQEIEDKGIVDDHAYTLIGAREIKLDNGKTERLLCVRNPWGKTSRMTEWKGDWSDASPLWTDHTR